MAPGWVTEEDEYVCSLSAEAQQVARVELKETTLIRDQSLRLIRDWIKRNARIANCRLDGNFLLRFLRAKKFNVLEACESLERYLLLRQTMDLAFRGLDITLSPMEEIVDLGFAFAVPQRDSQGRRVVVVRPGVIDPHRFTKEHLCRVAAIMAESFMEDEENQVRGVVYFGDGAGVGFSHLTLFTPKEAVRIAKNGERTLPVRHKEVHVINTHASLKFAMDFVVSLISDKIRRRVKIHTTLADAQKHIDCSLLPREYGGTTSMAEMIHLWKQELFAARSTLLSHDAMSVREEMYSQQAKVGAVSALRSGFRCADNIGSGIMGVTGSFRKLELD